MPDFFSQHYIEITYIACALLGGIMHWLKKFMTGETKSNMHQWFGPHNVAATFYTVTVFFFAIVGSLAADIINASTTFWAAMYTGFVTGFAIDSGFNRDMTDVNKDLLATRDSMHQMFGDGSHPANSVSVGARGVASSGRGADDSEADAPDEPQVTVADRRAQLRKKLGTE